MTIHENFSLEALNTFGIPAFAQYYTQIHSLADWHGLLGSNVWKEVPHLILGGGSNMLFTQNFKGLVVHSALKGIEVTEKTDDHVYVKACAGENWHGFVQHCLSQGWGGLENLSLIPGTVGAAPIQNIGAYGVEVKDTLHELEALDLHSGVLKTFSHAECLFGYRNSFFKQEGKGRYFIASVTFKLTLKNHPLQLSYGAITDTLKEMQVLEPTIQDVGRAVVSIRQSKLPDPAMIGNCGSFFKNPEIDAEQFAKFASSYPKAPYYPLSNGMAKIPAGWLIEQCGFKGQKHGNVGVYEKQALVLVNLGGATGEEALQLAQNIQLSVKQRFHIDIEPEVNLI